MATRVMIGWPAAAGVAALLAASCPAAAGVIIQADFNDGALDPFKPGQYGKGEYTCEVVEGVGRDGTPCARLVNTDPGALGALATHIKYQRGHVYTITFWARAEAGTAQAEAGAGQAETATARAEAGTARVNCHLDIGDWQAKFPDGYRGAVEVGEQWQQITFEQLHLQGRSYVVNVLNDTKSDAPLLVDDVVVTESEGEHAINWALADPRAEASADSLFEGYAPGTLNDGIQTYAGADFTRQAMATAEMATPHWAQIAFPAERPVSRVVIYWAHDRGHLHAPRSFEVQALEGEEWRTVFEGGETTPPFFTVCEFEEVATTAVRIYQPTGQGGGRADILWIAEVEVY